METFNLTNEQNRETLSKIQSTICYIWNEFFNSSHLATTVVFFLWRNLRQSAPKHFMTIILYLNMHFHYRLGLFLYQDRYKIGIECDIIFLYIVIRIRLSLSFSRKWNRKIHKNSICLHPIFIHTLVTHYKDIWQSSTDWASPHNKFICALFAILLFFFKKRSNYIKFPWAVYFHFKKWT